ncbi:MAG TPA: SLBB domain-containing protein [Acidobacteriaceae bacterium]|nr:SLBB domain-containing protein [Acidobacteriaceae bacterium]
MPAIAQQTVTVPVQQTRQEQTSISPVLALPAKAIMQLIDRQPEVAVELKRLLASRLRSGGSAIEDDGISDEALLRILVEDVRFRAACTLLLRTRGYVSDADMEQEEMETTARRGDPLNPDNDPSALYSSAQTDRGQNSLAENSLASAGILQGRDLSSNIDEFGLEPDLEIPENRLPEPRATSERLAEELAATPQGHPRHTLPTVNSGLQAPRRATQKEPSVQDSSEPKLLREPTPYNLLAMRDLYTQIPQPEAKLKRFGMDVFLTRNAIQQRSTTTAEKISPAINSLQPYAGASMDQALGPEYVIGRGDGLSIALWGGISQTIMRTVDPSGRVVLPEAGPVSLAGLKLDQAQAVVEAALLPQYRNVHAAVTVTRIRAVRIYVVGDVQRPGAYDIPAHSTPLNALYAAGGPTATGSLRSLRHMRGDVLVREVDLYDFLLRGVHTSTDTLEDGDTILVPSVGPQVSVLGDIKRPAIYELKGETTLSQLLNDAGGAQVSAALGHITVERVVANDHRETLKVGDATRDLAALRKELDAFPIEDGDRVVVSAIASWSERAIYVEGHVVRPGRQPYWDGMLLSDVLHSYQDLLPEPSMQGQIIRLAPPDLHPRTIDFNVADVLSGNDPIRLQPYDTIRVRGRYEFDAPKVTIRGEVLKPGIYALASGMTASQLVKIAGGLTRSALQRNADLASYDIQDGAAVVSSRKSIDIGAALHDENDPSDPALKPGDVLTIHQISGWSDIGASVRLAGEVKYPGSYGIEQGETLSSVLRRAGGLRATGYPDGAILMRLQVRELQEKNREDLIHQIETTSVAAKLGTNLTGQDQTSTLQVLQQQQNQVVQQLRSQTPSGRLVIKISGDLKAWENTPADLELRNGDVLIVPKRPGFVLVSGQVYNASALTYVPHKTAGWYLKRAGGTTDMANDKAIFIVRANGSVIGRRSGSWHDKNVLSTRLDAGDVIVVPQKIIGGSMFWRNMLTTAQLFSSIAIPLAIAGI